MSRERTVSMDGLMSVPAGGVYLLRNELWTLQFISPFDNSRPACGAKGQNPVPGRGIIVDLPRQEFLDVIAQAVGTDSTKRDNVNKCFIWVLGEHPVEFFVILTAENRCLA